MRVIGDRLIVTWNDDIETAPASTRRQVRTVSAWGDVVQSNLARRRVLVIGAGSVGLDVAVRLAASGLAYLTIMDFDVVKLHNLDRMIGARYRDAVLQRPKAHVAQREALRNATALTPKIRAVPLSICEPDGLREALDHDLIFCCVDRPWPRAVLNSLAYTDLIPVIDGGIAIDTRVDKTMRNATWRSHVIRPGRRCMACIRQLDMARVALDIQGLLDDPQYIAGAFGASGVDTGHNVAPLSINVAGALLAQYVSLSVAPGDVGEPGPLQYVLSTHQLDHVQVRGSRNCMYEVDEPLGDARPSLTDTHAAAAMAREAEARLPWRLRLLRRLDDGLMALTG
ncbi:MAG TPA: ThiF family adenylyltransferase [Polyangiaceae bacterium]|nr:ThiF family adenylyltransferase [Polyangiaceae bacterium]